MKTKRTDWAEKYFPSLFNKRNNSRILFNGQFPLVGWFFSRSPAMVWFVSCAVGTLVILGLSYRLGVHELSERGVDGRIVPNGIWFEPGWSLMFVLFLPIIFLLCSTIAHKTGRCLDHLQKTVFQKRLSVDSYTQLKGDELHRHFDEKLRKNGIHLSLGLLLASILLAAGDAAEARQFHTQDHLERKARYRSQHDLAMQGFEEWIVAKDAAKPLPNLPATTPPQRNWTIAAPDWYLVAVYALEALALFLGASFVASFFRFLLVLGKLTELDSESEKAIVFRPLIFDPERRLGLGCLGDSFNRYFLAVIVLQINVLLLRMDRIARANELPIFGYPDDLLALVPGLVKEQKDTFRTLFELSSRALGGLRMDEWFFLVLVPLGYFACVVHPLLHLRRYLNERRLSRWADMAQEYESAVLGDDEKKAKQLRKEIDALAETDPWPNGSATASKLLFALGALALGAWLPPILVYLAALGIGLSLYSWLSALVGLRSPAARAS